MCPRRDQPPEGIFYNSKLWRYMSLAKFVSMLSTREAWFSRVDCLDDIREAMLSPRTLDAEIEGMLANDEVRQKLADRPDGRLLATLTSGSSDMVLRASTFVNCWYRSEIESVGMWRSYGREGVAIQSTWKRLSDSFPSNVFVGKIEYVDYDSTAINPYLPFLYKDKIYEGEREIRLMIRRSPRENSILAINRDHPKGIPVEADLSRMIKRVYVAPGSGRMLKAVVSDLLAKYGLERKEVFSSVADHLPPYRQMYLDTRDYLINKAYPLREYIDDYPPDDPWGAMAAHERAQTS